MGGTRFKQEKWLWLLCSVLNSVLRTWVRYVLGLLTRLGSWWLCFVFLNLNYGLTCLNSILVALLLSCIWSLAFTNFSKRHWLPPLPPHCTESSLFLQRTLADFCPLDSESWAEGSALLQLSQVLKSVGIQIHLSVYHFILANIVAHGSVHKYREPKYWVPYMLCSLYAQSLSI